MAAFRALGGKSTLTTEISDLTGFQLCCTSREGALHEPTVGPYMAVFHRGARVVFVRPEHMTRHRQPTVARGRAGLVAVAPPAGLLRGHLLGRSWKEAIASRLEAIATSNECIYIYIYGLSIGHFLFFTAKAKACSGTWDFKEALIPSTQCPEHLV